MISWEDPFLTFCSCIKKDVHKHAINEYKYANKDYMQLQTKRLCTLMLLTNLTEPEWVSVECQQK